MQSSKPINKAAQPASQLQNKAGTDSKDGSLKSEPPSLFQAKLSVGAPDDPFEQEADKVSRQVMDNYEQVTSVQRKLSNFGLQKLTQSMPVGTINRKIHRRILRAALFLQSKSDGQVQFDGDGAEVPSQMEARIQSQRGSGQGMDPVTQTAMENSFGADFSSVKIHTDTTAVQMSRDLNAHAFTVGNDIFFNEGRYQPHTKGGAGLLAHELTHVVQQGAAVQNKSISRFPDSGLFTNTTLAKLSSVGGDAAQQARLYRKEIAQFQKEVPGEKMLIQQQQILQSQEVDKVQLQSNAKIMRLYNSGGSSSGGTPAPTPSKAPIRMRKVTSGTLEGGKKVSDYYPSLVGTNTWGSDTTAGPFDNGVRAGSVVQLIGEIPAGVSHTEYQLKQTATFTKLRANGTANPLEGVTFDDIARSGADQSKTPFRQVFGNNVTMCDPISGLPYNTLTTYECAASLTTSLVHIATSASVSVNWGVVIEASGGTVTKNTVT
jgi:hypothetical protein